MTHDVLLTAAARDQIEETVAWWAENRSLKQALQWQQKLHERIAMLADQPERWPLAHESSRFSFPLREQPFSTGRRTTHRILFRVIGAAVQVLAVRGVSQADVEPTELG